jgi:antitoxin component of MazEF toxin-antitoxin module
MMKIKAKTSKHPTPVEVEVNIPATLAEKVKLFGEDVVNASCEDSLIITVQALIRRMIEKGKVVAEIQAAVKEWKPDVRTLVRQSAFEKASSSLEKLSPEERKALLAKLQQLK